MGSPSLPFWAAGDPGRTERRDAPAGFGRSERTGRPENGNYEAAGITGSGGNSPRAIGSERNGVTEQRLARGPEPQPNWQPHSRRGEIAHLARDPRMPVWRRRLIIAVVLGVLVTVFTDWRVGLTVAVAAAIVDAFVSSRSSPGGAEGRISGAQRRTKRELAKMERSGYRSLHVRAIPGSDEVIDHFLVGPTGVYAIDSEQWDKRLPVRTRNGRQLYHGPYSQKERLEHALWEAAQASDLVGNALGEELRVRPAMAVYGPSIPWGFATIRDVDVFSGDKLRKYLRRHRARRDLRLAAPDIERIYAAADKVLPPKR